MIEQQTAALPGIYARHRQRSGRFEWKISSSFGRNVPKCCVLGILFGLISSAVFGANTVITRRGVLTASLRLHGQRLHLFGMPVLFNYSRTDRRPGRHCRPFPEGVSVLGAFGGITFRRRTHLGLPGYTVSRFQPLQRGDKSLSHNNRSSRHRAAAR